MPEVVGRLRTPRLAAAPSSPVAGEMYYDTVLNQLRNWNGTAWVSGGAALDLKYNGDFVAATNYNDGDIVVSNGVTYMCVAPTNAAPTAWPLPGNPTGVPLPVVNGQWLKGVGGSAVWSALTQADVSLTPYGTNLPSVPFDGQIAVLVDSLTNPSYQWRFRYNAGNTTAYKWEFIGGTPFAIFPADFTPSATGAYQNDTAAGSTITTPRAGYYICESATEVGAAVNSGQYMGFNSSDRMGVWVTSASEAGLFVRKFYTFTAGAQLQNTFYCSSALSVFRQRIISITPVRVS